MKTGDRLAPVLSWRSAIAQSDLTGPQKGVAHALGNYMNSRGGSACPSLQTLADDASVGRSSAAAALKVLEERGFVARSPGGGRGQTTEYEALIPETVRLQDGSGRETGSASDVGGARERVLTGSEPGSQLHPHADTLTVPLLDGKPGSKQSSSRVETVQETELNSPGAGHEVDRDLDHEVAAACARPDAQLAAELNSDAAAAELNDRLHQVKAGVRLFEACWAEQDRATAWLRLADDEATSNPAGFVMAGMNSGDWPSPRSGSSAVSLQAWVDDVSWRLDADHAHLIVEERCEDLDHDGRAMWHQAVEEARDQHAAQLAECAA